MENIAASVAVVQAPRLHAQDEFSTQVDHVAHICVQGLNNQSGRRPSASITNKSAHERSRIHVRHFRIKVSGSTVMGGIRLSACGDEGGGQ